MLEQITPVILTYNEEPNIGRVLERLSWAKRIVVVDSFSDDSTLDILSAFKNVQVFRRIFDSHARQWNYAIQETAITTEWILALDSDYVLPPEVVEEIGALAPAAGVAGYCASFRYCVFGKRLRGTLYPPVTVLFRREEVRYIQDGHTQRIEVSGKVENLLHPIWLDDRKSLGAWLGAQDRYMELEADVLRRSSWGELGWADRLRKMIVAAPVITFFYCLVMKQGLLDGRAGLYYAMQRTLAELILSLKLMQKR